MFDFQKTVQDSAQNLIADGRLQKMIELRIEKSIGELIDDALRPYSEFGKQLGAAVKSALAIDTNQLGFCGYNQVVLQVVKQKLNAAIETVGREKLAKEMEELLRNQAPQSIKLSELMDEFKSWARGQHGATDECTIIVGEEPKYPLSSRWVGFDPEPRKRSYDCQFRMLISTEDGKVTIFTLAGINPQKQLVLGGLHGFEKRMFHLYAAGTKVIIDQTDFDTYIGND